HVRELEAADDDVEPARLAHQRQRLGAGRHRGQPRPVVQVEVAELADHALPDLPRLLEHERVVRARHEQDVHDAVPHQLVEVGTAAAVLRARPGHRAELTGLVYTMPWSIIESATFMKPAMLAPAT